MKVVFAAPVEATEAAPKKAQKGRKKKAKNAIADVESKADVVQPPNFSLVTGKAKAGRTITNVIDPDVEYSCECGATIIFNTKYQS